MFEMDEDFESPKELVGTGSPGLLSCQTAASGNWKGDHHPLEQRRAAGGSALATSSTSLSQSPPPVILPGGSVSPHQLLAFSGSLDRAVALEENRLVDVSTPSPGRPSQSPFGRPRDAQGGSTCTTDRGSCFSDSSLTEEPDATHVVAAQAARAAASSSNNNNNNNQHAANRRHFDDMTESWWAKGAESMLIRHHQEVMAGRRASASPVRARA